YAHKRRTADIMRDIGYAAVAAGIAAAGNVALLQNGVQSVPVRVVAMGAVALVAFTHARHPTRFAIMIAAMIVASTVTQRAYTQVLEAGRTFFGTYRVGLGGGGRFYALFHGTTIHGLQAVDPSRRTEPLAYYDRSAPFGQAFERLPRLHDASDV